jgi:hypothetical protein
MFMADTLVWCATRTADEGRPLPAPPTVSGDDAQTPKCLANLNERPFGGSGRGPVDVRSMLRHRAHGFSGLAHRGPIWGRQVHPESGRPRSTVCSRCSSAFELRPASNLAAGRRERPPG